jgi:hypothetical protein
VQLLLLVGLLPLQLMLSLHYWRTPLPLVLLHCQLDSLAARPPPAPA